MNCLELRYITQNSLVHVQRSPNRTNHHPATLRALTATLKFSTGIDSYFEIFYYTGIDSYFEIFYRHWLLVRAWRHTPSLQIEFWDRLLIKIFCESNMIVVYVASVIVV